MTGITVAFSFLFFFSFCFPASSGSRWLPAVLVFFFLPLLFPYVAGGRYIFLLFSPIKKLSGNFLEQNVLPYVFTLMGARWHEVMR
jgi:hypothetical protein